MARTLQEAFELLLARIAPLPSERAKAVSHRSSVRRCLETNFRCEHFFETGSFGNKTGVRYFSDIDYFAVCPLEALSKTSSRTLRQFKQYLQATFWQTPNISVNSPAVSIPFGKHASEVLEITPCFYHRLIETPLGRKKAYAIPNGTGEWVLSSPQAHNAYVEYVNRKLDGQLKPLIRLVKAWKFYQRVPINSFYLELRTAKYAESKSTIYLPTDLFRILTHLYDISLARIQDPMKVSGYISACSTERQRAVAISKLYTGHTRALKACLSETVNIDHCFYWWNLLYNRVFPSRRG